MDMIMATKIKNSTVKGKTLTGLRRCSRTVINLKDQKLDSKDADDNVFELGNSNISNGGTDDGLTVQKR